MEFSLDLLTLSQEPGQCRCIGGTVTEKPAILARQPAALKPAINCRRQGHPSSTPPAQQTGSAPARPPAGRRPGSAAAAGRRHAAAPAEARAATRLLPTHEGPASE